MIGKLLLLTGVACAGCVVICAAIAAGRSHGAGSHQRPRPSFVPYIPAYATPSAWYLGQS